MINFFLGILVSQIMFFVVLTTSLWTLLSMYFRRDNFRLNILTTGICYLVLGLTMYCFNLMESMSPIPGRFENEFPINANNNGAVKFQFNFIKKLKFYFQANIS